MARSGEHIRIPPMFLILAAMLLPPAFADGDSSRGKTLYQANCLACHGAKADGKGPAAAALSPRPTDFTSAEWWSGKSNASVADTIRTGKPGTSMMAFAQLSDEDLTDLTAYLRSRTGGGAGKAPSK